MNSNSIDKLLQGQPIIICMGVDHGTLKQGKSYLLYYDQKSNGFDLQGYNTGESRYYLARYHNGDLNAGYVSLWGANAKIKENAGKEFLYLPDGQLIASICNTHQTQYLEDATKKVENDLSVLKDFFNQAFEKDYARVREVSSNLENLSRYYPFIYKKEIWGTCTGIMEKFYIFLKEKIDYARDYGVISDYDYEGTDFQTSAFVIRAIYAYYQSVGSADARNTFVNLSKIFMDDVSKKLDWANDLIPNTRMQIVWIISRRFDLGLENMEERLDAAYELLLNPTLLEQITSKDSWPDKISRGFGGWIHSKAGAYEQYIIYHFFIVRGLAEFYRLINRKGIAEQSELSQFFSKNCLYNLMAAISWIFQISRGDGRIMDRWHDPQIDGSQRYYGTHVGLAAIYEAMRTFNVKDYTPYLLGYPEDEHTPNGVDKFSFDELTSMLQAARRYADKTFSGNGLIYYPGLLLYYYPELRSEIF
jgi:hypothetical protein